MGRDCSGIMDAALTMADALLEGAYEELGVDPERVTLDDVHERIDEILRPHVRAIAEKLENLGWDTQEEVDQFWRFAQEITGYDDAAFESFLRYKVTEASHDGDAEEILRAAHRLKEHTDKMKAGNA